MTQEYGQKRDFSRTPEPEAKQRPDGEGPLTFVVQKHAARRLHYDFRLELDGVLKSWSVPKGPSLDPADKHLAVMVEDHPLEYRHFEGSIPKGEYGAGQVVIWDRGTYSPDEDGELSFNDRARAQERMREGLAKGKLSVFLQGQKLRGSWTLVKMQRREKDWLLIKHHDEYADPAQDVLAEGASVASGLTIDDIKAGHRPASAKENLADVPGAVTGSFPSKPAPMLAASAAAPFSNPDWLFEPKLDGFRTIALVQQGQARLLSRRGLDVTRTYKHVAESLGQQPASEAVFDGEVVALDARGQLCFQCLQQTLNLMPKAVTTEAEPPSAIIYYVFDILYLDGYDLRGAALEQRKELLRRVLRPSDDVRPVEHFEGNGETVYRAALENGFEGVIAKRLDSRYESGRRSDKWLKVKSTLSDEFVVVGFTRGSGSRAHTFGALLLGYYDDEGNLRFAGHVGIGFDEATLASLREQLDAIKTDRRPFPEEPALNAPTVWVKPELVAEVKFSQWTRDGRLRTPVFLRLRQDKPPSEARPTSVVPTPEKSSETTSDNVDKVLKQLSNPKDGFHIEVDGSKLALGNLDKELWPATNQQQALTKRDLLLYLAKVSPYVLPHLKDRPLTLSRYPDGIYGEHFYQKHWGSTPPDFVETVPLSAHHVEGPEEYILCNNLATLLWLGQIADIELHTWFSRTRPGPDFTAPTVSSPTADYYADFPDFIIFDIDPYIYSGQEAPGAEPELNQPAFNQACKVAGQLKETLDGLSLASFVKTSGRTGLHVFVPIMRQLDYHATRSAAETISRFLRQRHPRNITVDWSVERRTGKVFLDYNQNVRGKSLASIYSPRPSPEATVSIPLRWDELGKVYPTDFTISTVPARLAETGDLWSNILQAKVDISSLLPGLQTNR